MGQLERLKEERRDKVLTKNLEKRNRPTGSRYYRIDANGEEYVHDYATNYKRPKAAIQVAQVPGWVHPGDRPSGDKHSGDNLNGRQREHSNPAVGYRHRAARSGIRRRQC